MSNSVRFTTLTRQVTTLRDEFLPDKFDPLGRYRRPRTVELKARAFVVLCHAEIESFLEEWAKDLARSCERIWKNKGRFTEPFAFLIATLLEKLGMPGTFTGANVRDCHQRLSDSSEKLFQDYYKKINDNHGIKEANVIALFGPLGVPSTALAGTLLPNLDTFGAIRGVLAHHSSKSVPNPLDPETEYKRVATLLADLKDFDNWLCNYKQKIR